MLEQRMVLSPCTATTLPAKTALFSRSKTSSRSASILIGSLPPPLPKAPKPEPASFFLAGAAAGVSARGAEGKARTATVRQPSAAKAGRRGRTGSIVLDLGLGGPQRRSLVRGILGGVAGEDRLDVADERDGLAA